MFASPPIVETEVFASLPAEWRFTEETEWSRRRGSGPLHSFLEGPSFDRQGNLYCVDICHGRIFRLTSAGEWSLFKHYDGAPNGLKIHRDGRLFVTDQFQGLLILDPENGKILHSIEGPAGERFNALNDLVFAEDGTLYFTDPGGASLENPVGRIFRWREGGPVELVAEGLTYPNGLVFDDSNKALLIALSRTLQIIRAPLNPESPLAHKLGLFIQLSGGLAGPDGLALDEHGGLVVCHSGLACAWLFDRLGEPIARIRSCAGIRVTNAAYGGPDRKTLYLTESEQGVILKARMATPGRVMFSHR